MTRHSSPLQAARRFFRAAPLAASHGARLALAAALAVILGRERCARCGKPVVGAPLCASCRAEYFRWRGREGRCAKCGRHLVSETGLCLRCRERRTPSALDYCFPVFPYQLWYKDLLFLWKLRGNRLMSPLAAEIFARVIREDGRFAQDIIPVPPRPGKIRRQGWDQIEDAVRHLERVHGMSVLRLLARRSRVEQKKLSGSERARNAAAGYYVPERVQRKLAAGALRMPKRAVLLDDLRTTGATLEACAAALKAAGAEEVCALTLFGTE